MILYIAGGIVLLGVIVFLFFFIRGRLQSAAIKHYEKMRDKITLEQIEHSGKEKEEEKEDKDYSSEEYDDSPGLSGPGLLSSLIGGFMAIAMGVSLIGPITEQVKMATTEGNLSNASSFAPQVLQMIPTFFIIGIIGVALVTIWSALRSTGMV